MSGMVIEYVLGVDKDLISMHLRGLACDLAALDGQAMALSSV